MKHWYFRLAVIAAIAMLAIAPLMGISAPPCNPLPMSTLTAFELVRTTEEVQRILGLPGDACRIALAPQLDHANFVDMFGYIPAYTAFYGFAALGLGARDRLLGRITFGLAILCAVADVFENLGMFAVSAAPEAQTTWLTVLIVATNVKWVGLGLVTTLCGLMIGRRGGWWWLLAPLGAVPLATSLWAVMAPDAAGQYLIPGMTIASVMLLGVCIWRSVKREPRAADAVAA